MITGKGIKVFMRPAWNSDNLFTHFLADSLIAEGVNVRELGQGWRSLPSEAGIIFLHWPNEFFYIRDPLQVARAIAQLARLRISKSLSGLRIVWLVHNIEPHNRSGLSFFAARKWLFSMVDGLIFLSEISQEIFVERYPQLSSLPALVINHGDYLAAAIQPISQIGAIDNTVKLGYVGRIQRYKGPDILASTIAALPLGTADLLIAGACDDVSLGEELCQTAQLSPAIDLRFKYLTPSELEGHIDDCDAIVATYRDILNSGSTIYALSRARPFIGPRIGSLVEIQKIVGKDWMWLYDGDFTPEVAQAAIEWVKSTPRSVPDLTAFSWTTIGSLVAAFLVDIART